MPASPSCSKRFFLLFLLLTATPLLSYGQQSKWITPFNGSTKDSLGKRVYLQPRTDFNQAVSIYTGYGFQPFSANTGMGNNTVPILPNNYSNHQASGDVASNTGVIVLGFGYEVIPWLEINFFLSYSSDKGTYQNPFLNHDKTRHFSDSWFSLMPGIKIFWARSQSVSFYSRAGIGLALVNRHLREEFNVISGSTLAWQFSPAGVEIGSKNVCFYLEGGYGFHGIVNTGLRFRISTGQRYQQHAEYKEFLHQLLF